MSSINWLDTGGLTPQAFNTAFISKLAQDPESIRMVGDNFVRDRLREDMIFNAIIPQTPITPDRLVPQLTSDSLYEIIYLEPNAAAALVDFRGPGRGQIVRGRRVPLSFHMLKSDEFEVVEQELLVYPYPIVRLVHEYSVRAIGDIHDLYMLQNCQRSVNFANTATLPDGSSYTDFWGGGVVNTPDASGDSTFGYHALSSAAVTTAKQRLSNRIKPEKILVSKFDMDSVESLLLFEQGDTLRSKVFVQGYAEDTLLGLPKVVTTKQDIFRKGIVWFFAGPDFIGKNRVLDYGGSAYKLYIDRRSNVITWHVYATFGAIIANVGSLVRLNLYKSSLAASNKDTDPLQIAEQDLFIQRNLAEQLGRFPTIRQF
jgi:hypothetical protein